jgi:TM2 domain-containing membrane protein YozV
MKANNLLYLLTLLIITTTSCDNTICDEIGGICISSEICQCRDEYTTLILNNNYKLCNYERKRSINTAFLELLIGFGMGHFYCGRYIHGSIKLISFILLCCSCYCSIILAYKLTEENRQDFNNLVYYLLKIYSCVTNMLIFWQVIDFLLFICGVYLDGNNIALY